MQTSPLENAAALTEHLNEQQLAAVTTKARHALVIAGAGSGKTRTLTYRVAWLLSQGVPEWCILLLTFTNKAAREMLERVNRLVGAEAGRIWGGTFHSVANRILRSHAVRLGYQKGFSILDSDDQKALMRLLVKQVAGGGSKSSSFPKPELLLSLHSLALNTGQDWEGLLRTSFPHLREHAQAIRSLFESYAQRKREANAMDFDDLLTSLLLLLQKDEEVRSLLQARFHHVLVDEYQDTNVLQDRIISLLSGGERTALEVVGDDAQSIYSWRGARVDHIFDFTHRYPDAEVYKIETNYRSLPAILAVSNAAIAVNVRQFRKVLRPARSSDGTLPSIFPAPDNHVEALYVAERIRELLDGGESPTEIAVLYRAHFHSLDIQVELSRQNIPFRVTSGQRFFEQAHIKDVIAYLRLLANPGDEMAFRRIIAPLPKVGEATADKMWRSWQKACAAWAVEHPDTRPHFAQIAKNIGIPAAAGSGWMGAMQTLDELAPEGQELPPGEMIEKVLEHLEPSLYVVYENADDRIEDIRQLSRSLTDAESLDDFLSQVALLSETDTNALSPDVPRVTLSTIHQAKGLEWNNVFIIFLGEGMFPHYRVINSANPREIEEETRLFYVAVTRAKNRLFLSYPRFNGRSYDGQYCHASRFLTSLPPELYTVEES